MSIRLAIVALALSCLAAPASASDNLELALEFSRSRVPPMPIESYRPPEELFTAAQLARYRAFLADGNCAKASIYLDAASGILDADGVTLLVSDEFARTFSSTVVPRAYPQVTLCWQLRWLEETRIPLTAKGQEPPRFSQRADLPMAPYNWFEDLEIKQRNHSLGKIFWLALMGHAPAQIVLAEFSEKGEMLQLTPRFAYFLLASAAGTSPNDPRVAPMLDRAAARIEGAERSTIDARVVAGRPWDERERMLVD
ncbi:MAG: hypothetical protein GC150_11835 [Rhizobiales bacterium]|nr:hypothetical protein [Hyphomicrobiales bacterium]